MCDQGNSREAEKKTIYSTFICFRSEMLGNYLCPSLGWHMALLSIRPLLLLLTFLSRLFLFEKAYFLAGGPHLLPGGGGGGEGGGAGQHRLTGWRRNSRVYVADHGEKKDAFRHPVAVATCGESPLVLMPFLPLLTPAAC